ncbi:MAG TPA: hypothetical protein ACFYD6_12050 [Candidatus Brocadiia bacterium]|nr:hypothetical protein [Candidatus Brocadiales bacterium]
MRKRKSYIIIPLAFIFPVVLGLNVFVSRSQAKVEIDQMTVINHKPLEFFVPGKRILLHANIADPVGIAAARVYFGTSNKVKDLTFYLMKPQVINYAGIIPAPSSETEKIFYCFLAVDCNGYVAKTDFFELRANKEVGFVPTWQGDFDEYGETVILGKEYTRFGSKYPATVLEGFDDNLIVNKVKREEKYFFAKKAKRVPRLTSYECWRRKLEEENGKLSLNEKIAIGGGVAGAAIGGGIAVAVSNGDDDDAPATTTTTTTTTIITTTTTTTTSTTPTTIIPILPKQTFSSPIEGAGGGSITFTPNTGQVGTPVSASICLDTSIDPGSGWHIRFSVNDAGKDYHNVCSKSGECGVNCDLKQIFRFSSTPNAVKGFLNVEGKGPVKFFEESLPLEFND